jgi:hypothetical protein
VQVSRQNNALVITAQRYRLSFPPDRPFARLETPEGELLTELFPFSSVHPMNGRDDTYATGQWTTHEYEGSVDVTLTAHSTAWTSKTYRFHCGEERFTYDIVLEGSGSLAEVIYFGGHYSDSLRWSTGFFWSGQRFGMIFNPEPNIPETFQLVASSGTKIDMTGVPIPNKGDWFFTPPPFCFAGEYDKGWLAMGVECEPGKNTYTEYGYHGGLGAFYLSLAYEGHTQVDGTYTLPAIGFDFAADEYAALAAHVTAIREAGYVPIPDRSNSPDWWRTPIYCGWGSQCYVASLEKGHAPNFARQDLYDGFLSALEANDINPGIVVLDDKWQATYGDNRVDTNKWPDVRGFIDGQHAAGRKVLLWLKAWDPEGVPTEECVTHAGSLPVAIDVTNPAFEARLRSAVREMLSADGYDADGFKIDFTARIPSGYGLKAHGDLWGLEMMRRYLEIIYSEAKATKPDALVMSHTPHPYLSDVLDMIRLNDINIGTDVNRAMIHRHRVATIACPEAFIDTDNWPIPDKQTWLNYVAIQADLGVPSLYFATHIDYTGEPLTDDDYAAVRTAWAKARERQGV